MAGRWSTLSNTLLAMVLLVVASAASVANDDGYTYSTPSHFGTGKSFMGRPIANVVDANAADWFDREDRAEEEGADKLPPLLGIRPNDVIADIGAGTGYFSFRLSKLYPKTTIYAEDIQKEMMASIQARKARGEGPNVIPVLGTETDPQLPSGSIDLILLVDVYHEMLYPREMGAAMMRALKPGGRIAMVEYRGEDPEVPASNLHKMTAVQARREMAALGFASISTDSTTLPLHHVMIFQKVGGE